MGPTVAGFADGYTLDRDVGCPLADLRRAQVDEAAVGKTKTARPQSSVNCSP